MSGQIKTIYCCLDGGWLFYCLCLWVFEVVSSTFFCVLRECALFDDLIGCLFSLFSL